MNSRKILIEISQGLLEAQGEITVRLKGNCMWPTVRDGDIVRIKEKPYVALKAGDVAVFQTTSETLHANTCFRAIRKGEATPKNYVGAIDEIKRGKKNFRLENRSKLRAFVEIILSPANPYGIGIFKTVLNRLFRRKYRLPRN